MKQRLLIIGAGGHGWVVADIASCLGYQEIAFIDQRWPSLAQNLSWPVISSDVPEDLNGSSVVIALGQNQARLEMLRELQRRKANLPNLIHPSAIISQQARLGVGLVAAAQAVIGVGSIIGDAAIINTGASVDHDCVLGDGVHISPGARLAGSVRIGDCSWIGMGAVIREGTCVGRNVIVGAGAAVVADITDGSKVSGVPARPMP